MLDKLKEAKWNDCAPSGHGLNKMWIILVFCFVVFNYYVHFIFGFQMSSVVENCRRDQLPNNQLSTVFIHLKLQTTENTNEIMAHQN